MRPYAWRDGQTIWDTGWVRGCSAEYPEDLALELGDRVAMSWWGYEMMLVASGA